MAAAALDTDDVAATVDEHARANEGYGNGHEGHDGVVIHNHDDDDDDDEEEEEEEEKEEEEGEGRRGRTTMVTLTVMVMMTVMMLLLMRLLLVVMVMANHGDDEGRDSDDDDGDHDADDGHDGVEHPQQPERENGFQMHNTIHEDRHQQMKLLGSVGEAFNVDDWSLDLCTLLQDRMQCQVGFARAGRETCQLRPQKLWDNTEFSQNCRSANCSISTYADSSFLSF
ncbi:hypothetical protein AK812_SmicGene30821 [Symbiodinium microadriaticum]|uniref:Uncharacterized protein n=1 Tax=Symbiodinium microadriaticum TaxID=2951 RepID=A0A1Q9CYD5_SYMMI|nr:hypothetical protein AK812_SmicGene30821 [Symbiodinium microadriaticum]